jgi:hypothetical protein
VAVPLADIEDDYTRAVERERRRRERELWLLLLAMLASAERQATIAVLHEFDWRTVIRNVIAGGPNHRGAARDIARTMAQAHRDGYRRVGLTAGTRDVARADAGTLADLIALYEPQARIAAQAMAQAVTDRVYDGLLLRAPGQSVRDAIREAFDSGGYSAETPYAVQLTAERAVVGAHNGGIFGAVRERPELNVTGIRHVSILDSATTEICRQRHDLQLPVDHEYWRNGGIPQLHFRCRSSLRPLFGDFIPTATLPTIPPMAGFGYGPLPPFARAA